MPLYTLKKVSTGEEWDVNCPYEELQSLLDENSDVVKVLSTAKFSSNGVKDNISKAGGEWRDLLGTIKKGSGKKNTIKV